MLLATLPRSIRLLACIGMAALAAAVLMQPSASRQVRAEAPKPAIDFNRQIRPILSENCFACHGPDEAKRKAKLRLDVKAGAFAKLRHGGFAIVPGNTAESELIARVTSDEETEAMPPPKFGKRLKPEQVTLLKEWIARGAKWSEHWAFVAPVRPPLPKVTDAKWPRGPIDYYVLARLEKEGLKPSPEADRTTLIRRVTLDLTGLPPTPAEIDNFLADPAPDAYEKVVDRLLKSPRYGEHRARYWLDAARYGDTHGLHLDNYREIWPYREWVINAFNRNLPYDRFVIEQLAGDLLPNATLDQQVATGFNRCHVSTSEGGSIEEEVYVRNVVDQVDTNGTVFLGLSTGCARCHDHKYDPIRQKDYYQLFAFFNSIDGPALDGNSARPGPVVKVPNPAQAAQRERLQQKAAALQRQIDEEATRVPYDDRADASEGEFARRADYVWIDDELPAGAKPSPAGGPNRKWNFVTGPDHPIFSGSKSLLGKADSLSQAVFEGATPGLKIGEGDVLFTHVFLDPTNPPKEIMLQWHTKNWEHRAYWGGDVIPWGEPGKPSRLAMGPLPKTGKWVRLEVEAAKAGLKPGTMVDGWAFTQQGGTVYWDKAGLETWTPQESQRFDTLSAWVGAQRAGGLAKLPKPIQDALAVGRGKRSEDQKKQLRAYFLAHGYSKTQALLEPFYRQLAEVEKERTQIEDKIPTTLVFKDRSEPRPSFVLARGEYERKGEQVGRDVPAFLPPLPKDAPRNRLGFARWLVAPENPLTARVEVNRLWQELFGTGLVKTTEDFGTQGELPSHPELLDWLAVQFREDGWDVKGMVKRIVTSATYRQSSRVTPERLAKDPEDRLLSRGPRYRLEAEELRDQALFVSGLLVEKLGGPSVKPPQPSGLWEAVGYTGSNTVKFVADTGNEKVHRRSLYTFWKRTAPPPQMSALDAPSREACTVRRERTDTPLQALLLLNEKQFVECARELASRAMREAGDKPEDRAAYAFRLATGRKPDAKETAELVAAYKDQLAAFERDPEGAKKLLVVGESKPDPKLDAKELAAWTMIANLILNLDEVLNKG